MTLDLGLVGCGGMGMRHAYGYIELRRHFDSFRLAAVCDLHDAAANHLAGVVEQATGDRPKVYTDYGQMLETERDLAAIDIATDTRMHHIFAIAAFDAGVHVLTEKPMGLTMKACRRMKSAAEKANKVLSVGEQYRRDPMNRLTRALINSGAIGQPHFALKVSVSGGSALMHNTGWRALKSRAGSVIIEQGVHEADLLIYFLGDVDSVYARTGLFTKTRRREGMNATLAKFYEHRVEDAFAGENVIEIDQEDTALGLLQFKSGAIGQFTISNASHGYSASMNSIHGSHGTVLLPPSRRGMSPKILVEGRTEPLSEDEMLGLVPEWELDEVTATFFSGKPKLTSYGMTFEEIDRILVAVEMQELAQAIESKRPLEVGPDEGMQALGVVYGLLESGMAGQPVRMADVLDGSVDAYQQPIDEATTISSNLT